MNLEGRHEKFKQGYHDPIESLDSAHNLAITRDRQWREKREELTTAQTEIAHLHGQLSRSLAIQDHAFVFGHGVRILRLKNRLLATPDTNLVTLDLSLFSLEVTAFHQVDTYGCDDMLDAFVDVLPLPHLDEFPAPVP